MNVILYFGYRYFGISIVSPSIVWFSLVGIDEKQNNVGGSYPYHLSIYLFNFMYFIFFQVGSIYLFNLLLGTGVLTMPAVFENAGYISGIICLTLLCLISYVQTTFLIESMANANFVKRMQQSNGKFFFNYLIFIITW